MTEQEQHSTHVLGNREQEQENATRKPAVGDKTELPRIIIKQTDEGLVLLVEVVTVGGTPDFEGDQQPAVTLHEARAMLSATLTAVDENTRAWDGIGTDDLDAHVWAHIWALLSEFEAQHGEWVRETRVTVEPIVESSATPTPGEEQ